MLYFARVTALVFIGFLAGCSTSGSQEASVSETEPSQLSDTASGEQANADIAAQPFDPIKCKKIRPTGTRMSYKVCKKVSEWERIQEGSRKAGEDIQRRAVHQNTTL